MFYDIFAGLCASKGVSPSKAAESIGLKRSSVVKWKNGALPSSSTLQKLSEYFGVTTDYLLGAEAEKALTPEGEREISKDELKFALWGDVTDITDDDLEDVRRYAAFIKERKKRGHE